MKPRTSQSPDEYRIPSFAPDGTIEFAPDPSTGEEQIDLRMSNLDRMQRDAEALADSLHGVDPENIDTRRVEFGGTVIEAAGRFAPQQPERDMTRPEILLAHGAGVNSFRRAELDEMNNTKAA